MIGFNDVPQPQMCQDYSLGLQKIATRKLAISAGFVEIAEPEPPRRGGENICGNPTPVAAPFTREARKPFTASP
jgi:hypothetical protein